MANSTFDTYQLVKTLGAAGMPEKQAEAITAAIRKQHEVADVVTKTDFEGYKLETRHEFELLRREMATKEDLSKLELRVSETKSDLLKWMAGFAVANMTLLIAIAAFLVTR